MPPNRPRRVHPIRPTLANAAGRLWPLIRRILLIGFMTAVVVLLVNHARGIDWQAVTQSLAAYSPATLLTGAGLALAAYLAFSLYDLFGRHVVRHGISVAGTMMIAFVCLAFTLNLGAMVGSVGFRYRMYSQRGVGKTDIAQIIGISIATNWLGYALLAGVVFISGKVTVPPDWASGEWVLRATGILLLGVVFAYLALCRFARRRTWQIRGHLVALPSLGAAGLQLLVSVSHWLLMCGVIFSLLNREIGYFALLGVLLVSGIAGVVSHVPGALGVLEAVFIALLGNRVDEENLVAALIAYRALFYLWPLSIALVLYGVSEVAGKRRRGKPGQG